jgi:glycerophosphoryl diester phosphodiesterase
VDQGRGRDATPSPGLTADTLLFAHRAGNDRVGVHRAEAVGADAVEADVHLHRGRLELRHAKRLGPLPFHWDRWYVRRAPRSTFRLDQLLDAIAGGTQVMLDLKGIDRRLPADLDRALAPVGQERPVIVCSRSWRLLDALPRDGRFRRVYSAGSRRQLAAVADHARRHDADGIAVHSRLLTPGRAGALAAVVPLVMTWAVRSIEALQSLADEGVKGFVLDDLAVLQHAAARRAPA